MNSVYITSRWVMEGHNTVHAGRQETTQCFSYVQQSGESGKYIFYTIERCVVYFHNAFQFLNGHHILLDQCVEARKERLYESVFAFASWWHYVLYIYTICIYINWLCYAKSLWWKCLLSRVHPRSSTGIAYLTNLSFPLICCVAQALWWFLCPGCTWPPMTMERCEQAPKSTQIKTCSCWCMPPACLSYLMHLYSLNWSPSEWLNTFAPSIADVLILMQVHVLQAVLL